MVVAEGLGDDRGGHVQDVLADGAGPAGGCGDAEVADERGEGIGVHGLPGAAAGKQPAGVVVGGGAHVVAVVNPGEQDVGDWGGQRGWRVSEPQQDLIAVMDYVVDGQADDPAEGLGVEQDDDGRDPGPQRQVAAGEEVAEQVQSLVLLKRCRVPGRRGGQPEARGEVAGGAPQQEGSQGVAAVLVVFGVPGVDVGLAAGGQAAAAVSEPAQEGGGVLDLVAGGGACSWTASPWP